MKFTNVCCIATMCTAASQAATAMMSPEESVTRASPTKALREKLAIPVTDDAICLDNKESPKNYSTDDMSMVRTLRQRLNTPVAENDIASAKRIMVNAEKGKKLHLEIISKIVNGLFGCTEDNPIPVTPILILASYLVTHASKVQKMEPVASQQACDNVIVLSTIWMCWLEQPTAVELVQQAYNAEPDRDGWQQLMNSWNITMFATELYGLLKSQEDCRMTELKGRAAWLGYVNQLLDSVAPTIASYVKTIRRATSTPSAG